MFRGAAPARVDQLVPPAAAGLGRALQPRPRRQRRAEDHGHHRRRAARRRSDRRVLRSRSGSCSSPTPPSRSARCRAAGASSTRWARRSRGCSPSADSPPRPRAPISLFTATALGVPVSTTHTITGAIVGVGRDAAAVGRALGRGRGGSCGRGCSRFPRCGAHRRRQLLRARRRSELAEAQLALAPHALDRAGEPRSEAPPPGAVRHRDAAAVQFARCLTIARPRPVPPGRPRDLSTR